MTWTQRNPLPCVVPFLKKKANLNSPDARVFSPCFCLLKLYPSLSSSRQAAMAMVGQREERGREGAGQVLSSFFCLLTRFDRNMMREALLIAAGKKKKKQMEEAFLNNLSCLSICLTVQQPRPHLCHLLVAQADNKY